MKTLTSEGKHGIQWRTQNQLDDLDFADDLALLSHTHEKNADKDSQCGSSLCINVESFTYLGSIIDEQGGSDAEVKARIGKARVAFVQLNNVLNSKQLSTNIKVRIFNTNVKTVLLYAAETWRTTTTIIKKVQIFINGCLRKILNIHWPDTINNSLL
ncbi:unnamed protein product [Schistosoma margrebowiei]|uniref:Uncharacterized protein n=1 Tax=Schistosoma margrebowiei TaxID=48269 RepID=A0A183LN26_9TREM|nr:unnamed protein product [Schistosoma margrebowiei]